MRAMSCQHQVAIHEYEGLTRLSRILDDKQDQYRSVRSHAVDIPCVHLSTLLETRTSFPSARAIVMNSVALFINVQGLEAASKRNLS